MFNKSFKNKPMDYKIKPLSHSINLVGKVVIFTALAASLLYLPACSNSKKSKYTSGYGTRERCIEKKMNLKYQRYVAVRHCK